MKIIFLDIDGVLNSAEYMSFKQEEWNSGDDSKMIDENSVSLLNKIVQETGAKVVISSSWRLHFTIEKLREILCSKGFIGEIIDKTPTINPLIDEIEVHGNIPRGLEIQKWLRSKPHNIESFVILDDNSDMVHLSKFLVKTTWEHGMLEQHVLKAIEILNKESKI